MTNQPDTAREPEIPKAGFALAFGLTWISYASYYLGRKGLSVVKVPLMKELGDSVLVGVETGFLAAYALGQYLCGLLGDRIGSRALIGAGYHRCPHAMRSSLGWTVCSSSTPARWRCVGATSV